MVLRRGFKEEAEWFAGCLLLPRSVLLKAARSGEGVEAIAERHQLSEGMVDYRLKVTGVRRQIARRGA